MRHNRLSGAAVGCVAAVALVATPSAATDSDVIADTDNVTVTRDGDWITRQYQEDLADSTERRYAGIKTEQGCVYSGSETVDPDKIDGVVEEREIAHNEAQCILVTEVGVQSAADISNPDELTTITEEGTEVSTEEGAMAGRQATPQAGPTARLASRSAWHRTYYEDPFAIDVNAVKTNVTWSYNGSCVTSASGQTASYSYFHTSGWSIDWKATTKGRTCSSGWTKGRAQFFNGIFCAGGDTYTKYDPNRINGQENGTYTMNWTVNKWGACNSWLSFHRTHGS